MVIGPHKRSRDGWLMLDLAIAIALLLFVVLPLAFSFAYEKKVLRASYQRALRMEILDGEFETLLRGEWRRFPKGEHSYPVSTPAMTNLPSGGFVFTRGEKMIRLEWRPAGKNQRAGAFREASL